MLPGMKINHVKNSPIEREAVDFIKRIDDLLEEWSESRGEPRYGWAADTLEGIKESVLKSGNVTAGQVRAVDNIENSRRR